MRINAAQTHQHQRRLARYLAVVAFALATILAAFSLSGCSDSAGAAGIDPASGESANPTPGAGSAFVPSFEEASYDAGSLSGTTEAGIDVSHANEGYVVAVGTSKSHMKFQVSLGDVVYNYDLPNDGTPTTYPLNVGDGTYRLAVLKNTSESRYVELYAGTVDVELESEFDPFLRPSYYCSYTAESACVAKARELVEGAATQTEAMTRIYDYVIDAIDYDIDKAQQLNGGTGYVPDPDATLAEGMGICSDYASLAAAMLRSQGIPAKLMMGYVSPGDLYHAWNMVYVDGAWQAVGVDVQAGSWSRLDPTFAASGALSSSEPLTYTDRYTY